MSLIRIINGTYGHRPERSNYVIPVTSGDPPISVEDDEAKRLVDLGVAAYVEQEAPAEAVATALTPSGDNSSMSNSTSDEGGESGDSDPGEITGHLVAEDLMTWKVDDLKKLAADMGIDTTDLKKKAALVDAICAVEVSVPAEAPAPDVEDVVE